MNGKNVLIAVFLYMLMSLSSVVMKIASLQEALIYKGIYYVASMFILGVFALLWQRLLKKYDLSKVYIFKSTTIIWGMVFGYFIFHESVSWQMIIGSIVCLIGVIIVIGEKKDE